MRNKSFRPLSPLLDGLRRVKFFLLGLMADAVLACGIFAYFWSLMPIDCSPTCTMSEYLKTGRDIIGMAVILFIWLWFISIPVFAAAPGVGLWADLRRHAAKD